MSLNQLSYWVASSLVFAQILLAPAQAQIVPDSTLPSNSVVPMGCQQCVIEGGTVRGSNLFHSFQTFSVPTGGAAWFNNAATIQNILTRVTGSTISNIDGLLKTNGTANLFFLNPNGVVFGPNARLEIGGSFHASTASSFQFADGSEFSATNPQAPPLLTVNITPGLQYGPNAPGATIANRGTLTVGQDLTLQGDRLDLQGTLQAGRDLTLLATDTVQARDTVSTPFLAQASRHLTIQGNQGVDLLALNHLPQKAFVSGGDTRLISDGIISADAHFAIGGNFQVASLSGQAAQLTSLYDPIISAAGDITISGNYTGAALLIESLGNVFVQGNISITTPDAAIAPVDADTALLASSKALIIRSGKSTLAYAPTPLPTALNGGTFQAGSNLPPGITITGGVSTGGGVAGPIILEAGQGNVTTGALNTLGGPAGNISVSAPNGNVTVASIFGLGINGNGANVRLATGNGNVTVGNVFVAAVGSGNGGNVEVVAGDRGDSPTVGNISTGRIQTWAANARAGNVTLATTNGNITPTTSILAYADNGNGGNVTLTTTKGDIIMPQNSDIQTRACLDNVAGCSGNGGNITVSTGNGNISLDRVFSYAAGDAGNVSILSPQGKMATKLVLAHSYAAGKGGDINVVAGAPGIERSLALFSLSRRGQGGSINIDAISDVPFTTLNSTGFTGSGAININSGGTVRPNNQVGNGIITSDTFGPGRGGDITITAKTVQLSVGAQATASAHDRGNAGNVRVRASEAVQISGILPLTIDPTGLYGTPSGFAGIPPGTYIGGYIPSGNLGAITTPEQRLFPSGIFSQSTAGATGAAGTIQVDTPNLTIANQAAIATTTFGSGGGGAIALNTNRLVVDNGSILSGVAPGASGSSGGIAVQTQTLDITNQGLIQSQTLGSGEAGAIQVNASTAVTMTGANSAIRSGSGNTQNQGAGIGVGANIRVTAPTVRLANGAQLSAETHTTSTGGSIFVTANQFDAASGGQVRTTTFNAGQAGNINLAIAEWLTLTDGGTGLFADTASGSAGAGGSIAVTTPGVQVSNGAAIAVDSRGNGPGGSIDLQSRSVNLTTGGAITATAASSGSGGSINIQGEQLTATQGGQIRTTASSAGPAGNIRLALTGDLRLTDATTGLFADTASGSTGSGGSILASVRTLQLAQSAAISADSRGGGPGGSIDLQARSLNLTTGGAITATAAGQGNGGSIAVRGGQLTASQGGQIRTTASNAGQAGNIQLALTGDLNLTDATTGLFADTRLGSTGNGGSIFVAARDTNVKNGAAISVDSKGSGTGGSIDLQGRRLSLSDRGLITAETASAQGGDITLAFRDLIILRRNSLISATAGTAQAGGDGGNIRITTPFIISVLSEDNDIRANAFTGQGGQITINALGIFGLRFRPSNTPFSDITASSEFGLSGTVTLNTLNVDPNRGLVSLPVNFADATGRISQTCVAQGKNRGRFVVTGPGGLPTTPFESGSSDRALTSLVEPIDTPQTAVRPDPASPATATTPVIVEAQGMAIAPDGSVQLVSTAAHPQLQSPWTPSVPCPEP